MKLIPITSLSLESLMAPGTLVSINNSDLDLEATYPSVQQSMNAANETTMRELEADGLEGHTEAELRKMVINLSGGIVNSNSFCKKVFKLPCGDVLLEEFMNS